jgi:hypothetical protein
MTTDLENNQQQLKMLSIGHYVLGGLTGLFSLFPLIHVGMGIMMLTSPETFASASDPEGAPAFAGWFFIGIGTFIIVLGLSLAVLIIEAGRGLSQQRKYTFCFVIACIECMNVPLGTVLGVLTLMALNRPEVKEMFETPKP